MAYIGKQPVVGNFVKLDAIVTSATATYNLLNGGVAYFPQTANNCIVSLNGVIQSPTSAYTISGSTIVFSDALTSSDSIDFILVLGDVLSIGTPSDATVSFAKVTSNLITGATAETSIAGGDSVLIYDDSAAALRKMTRTNFVSGLSVTNTPAFKAYKSTAQTGVATGTLTKVTFQTELFDSDSNFASSTFTPTTSGKYSVIAKVASQGAVTTNTWGCWLYKNGTVIAESNQYTVSGLVNPEVSTIVDMNGTTDYLEVYLYQTTGSNQIINDGQANTYFSAFKLIGA